MAYSALNCMIPATYIKTHNSLPTRPATVLHMTHRCNHHEITHSHHRTPSHYYVLLHFFADIIRRQFSKHPARKRAQPSSDIQVSSNITNNNILQNISVTQQQTTGNLTNYSTCSWQNWYVDQFFMKVPSNAIPYM